MSEREETQRLGTELADWLDGLGLLPHLAEAGLPTVERTGAGVPVWREADGTPLSLERLRELETELRGQGEDPRHAVPVGLIQVARRAETRARLLASPTHTYASLAALRGVSENAARFAVHKAAQERRLLLVPAPDGGDVLVPAFQLLEDGEPRPELSPVLEPLLAAQGDPFAVWSWLTQPAALLGGAVPEVLATDPDEADVVVTAAIRLGERMRATPR
ncbi:hypothetical protein [Nocardioides sp. GY 10127]|uniref:hypothetical protein n=1 Tax=Nocardioides sp. GY 10127 TaxID=2569762 RepID=UPI0010A7CB8B|nr:hypothetical protein [Nocardioides sp. GY 10127]TIC80163.1 hypothetical protein E8D37_16355 [Nocardioides sp. GY 10127]